MPNDCTNVITITCKSKESLTTLIKDELSFDEDTMDKNEFKIIQQGDYGVIFKIWSPWEPNYEWLETLSSKYPECWIKNEWNEEGGQAGIWIGYIKDSVPIIKKFTWDDLSIEDQYYFFNNENQTKI